MTDPVPNPSSLSRSRRLRWLLIASLTLNLLVVGVVAGVALRHAGGQPPPAPRSIGFGPWGGGLERSDFKALREAYSATGRDFRADSRADRADRDALLAALRTEPFDPAALDAITARMNGRAMERMELGDRLMRAHILAMAPEQRRAFADRLEASRKQGRDSDKDRGRPPRPRD